MIRTALLTATIACAALPADAAQPAPGFGDIVPALLPAVVNVYSMKIDAGPSTNSQASQLVAASPRKHQSLGSGFIIDPSGIIVTNEHVIEHAYDISVTFQDNLTLTAQVIGANAIADIALLKVHAAKPLPAVKLGDSRTLRIGDPVFAIGNPLGFGGSVSAGIVSALNRDIMLSPYDDYIQTDAAINHGNSGGPLFNAEGEVVGIDTALYAPMGETGFVGLGFAIPWNDAAFVVRQLRKNGYVRAGYLGADLQQVSSDIAAAVGLPMISGAIVNRVEAGGPADKAGLRQGDVILKAGDRYLSDARAVARAVAEAPLGQPLPLGVWRNGNEQTIPVIATEWPGDREQVPILVAARPPVTPDLGLQLAAITVALRDLYKLSANQAGVVVTGVEPLSPADDRGLREGEVIVSVQMKSVHAPSDVLQDFNTLRQQGRHYALILVQGKSAIRSVALPLNGG